MTENQPGSDVEETLGRARRALSPTETDRANVWRSLGVAVAAEAAEDARRGAQRAVGPRRRLGPWGTTLATSVLVAGTAGYSGYRAGRRAGLEDARASAGQAVTSTPALHPSPPDAPPRSPILAPDGTATGPRPVPEPPHVRRQPRRPQVEGVVPNDEASLEKEVRGLRSVERALRDGQAALALALLGELDRDVPHGKLIEERDATAAIARCALGDVPFDVDLAEIFASKHPGSVYLERVRRSCVPEQKKEPQTDRGPSGDELRNRR